MRLYILAPNGNEFSKEQQSKLASAFDEVIFVDKVMPFDELPKIKDDAQKIIAIDPDFCNWNIPDSALDIKGLKAVCLNTTSYSWINLRHAKSKNIAVTNVRHWSTNSVAEKAIAMALNLAIKLPLLLKNNMEIDFTTMRGMELKGKTAGIIGLGHIGKRIAELCQGLSMQVIYWSKNSTDNRFQKRELNELFKTADIIFPALLKNKETETLITDEHLRTMHNNAMFVEVTENFLYNHNLLLQLSKDNKIFGYAFEESSPKTYEGNTLALPPLAYYTK